MQLILGDCMTEMKRLADAGVTVHSIVTDPPYGLVSTVKRFGKPGAAPAKSDGPTGVYRRASAGFMGQRWDGTGIETDPEMWRLCYDLLPPGGHLLSFGGTRTWHRIAVAIEDAGFEIRDSLLWLYGTGFPKSHDVAKGIDKVLGVKGSFGGPKSEAHIRYVEKGELRGGRGHDGWQRPWMDDPEAVANAGRAYIPGSAEAAAWSGWGTAYKPAWEPVIVARKPLVGTVAANVLAHRVGALNIDGCRIGTTKRVPGSLSKTENSVYGKGIGGYCQDGSESGHNPNIGRWPANVLHDGSEEVEAAFALFGERTSGTGAVKRATGAGYAPNALGRESRPAGTPNVEYGDSGSASRFFYCAKASKADRGDGNIHPTVKPTDLMRWLCRSVTPPGGTVLDPFMGSGSTGKAAMLEGFHFVGIEQDEKFFDIARRRIGEHDQGPELVRLLRKAAYARAVMTEAICA